jgi:hypothetical protein
MPIGKEFTKIAIASTISRPANQSLIILVMSTLSRMAPMPETSHPAMSTE